MSSVIGPCCRERFYFRFTIFLFSLNKNILNKTDIWKLWKVFETKTQEVKKTLTKNSRFNVRYCFIHKLTVTKQNRQKLFPHIVNHICIQNEAKLNKKDNFARRFSVWISIIVIVVIFNFKFLFILSSIFAFIQAVPCFFNFISLLKVFALFCFDFFFTEVRVTLNIATS